MISVIVPVYKSEKTLRGCVESLRAQTHKELEIILVDDGSPDDCPAVCDALAREYEQVWVIHKENGGVSSARNAGIAGARGKYVAFVDSDDYVEPDYLEHMLQAVESVQGNLAVCGYHHHYIGADVEKLPMAGEDLLTLYSRGFLNMPWNKLFLRESLGAFPEDLSLGEDLLFNLAYLENCPKVALVEEPLYHYIQEESGQTLSSQKRENKLQLAKRIRKEAGDFFRRRAEAELAEDEQALAAEHQRIRCVVDTRFLCECLDDVEKLPFDRERTGRQKRTVIRLFIQDEQVREACKCGAPQQLDYKILQWSLGTGLVWLTYGLSVLRSLTVRAKRALQ
ncbi:MAG: glycosyltransferase family 2 protein [Lachnospiraceae bacterium]|nr:glycosyltransferase family 2 protein [Lachnospiraceae bacterium]